MAQLNSGKRVVYPRAGTYTLHPQLLVRAPLLPLAAYGPHSTAEWLGLPEVRLALRLASDAFYQRLADRDFSWEALSERERATLQRYHRRMCFRATPFGAFASVSLASWRTAGPIELVPYGESALVRLPEADAARPDGQVTGMLALNPLFYRRSRAWRYYFTVRKAGQPYDFRLCELETGRLNNAMVKLLQQGPRPAAVLAAWVETRTGASYPEAMAYVRLLAEEQVLLPATTAPVLCAYGMPGKEVCALKEAAAGTGPDTTGYFILERGTRTGGAAPEDRSRLLAALGALCKMGVDATPAHLRDFISSFRQRYEGRTVPLLEALDPDNGLAYGDLRMEDAPLSLPAGAGREVAAEVPAQLRKLFSRLLTGPARKSFEDLELTDQDLAGLPGPGVPLPPSVGLLYRRTTRGTELDAVSGASALQLLGRFSVCSDEVRDFCRRVAEREEAASPGVIFAEVSHEAEAHTDHINRRQALYRSEIALNVHPAAGSLGQIRADGLYLRVSGNELLLICRRSGRRVVPRLPTAYNYTRSHLGVFQLLCDLQYQGLARPGLPQLRTMFPGAVFYPAVRYRDVTLAPACWQPSEAMLTGFRLCGNADAWLQKFCRDHAVPDMVALGQGDQHLVLRLSDPADRLLLCREMLRSDQVLITEYFPPDDWVRSDGQPLAAQYNAVFVNTEVSYPAAPELLSSVPRAGPRFYPGSEWVYLKIYCSPAGAEEVLKRLIGPLLRRYRKRARRWFFVRFEDTSHHLRLRFRMGPGDGPALLHMLQALLRSTGLSDRVRDLVIATYEPETEKYTPERMSLVEAVFEAGSELVLSSLAGPAVENGQLLLGMLVALDMITVVWPDARDQLHFVQGRADAFLAEHDGGRALKLALDEQYRQVRPVLEALADEALAEEYWRGSTQLRHTLKEQVSALSGSLVSLRRARRFQIMADIVHMQFNRTFTDRWRDRELIAWYGLKRYLEGFCARAEAGRKAGAIASQNASR